MYTRISLSVPSLALLCCAATATALLVWQTSRIPVTPAQAAALEREDNQASESASPVALPDTTIASAPSVRAPGETRRGDLDPVEAEMTTQWLAMHVAADLPYGAVMPRALDDGSIQVDAWYSSTRIAL